MSYIIYCPEHDIVRPSITKPDGEVIPEKVFHCEARALYKCKGLPDRRYRSGFPIPNDSRFFLKKCRTLREAREERDRLKEYSGEDFEIREWVKGTLGGVVQ